MPTTTIHQSGGNPQVALQVMPNRLLKTPISLYKSCRGMLDLQLSYLSLRAVRLRNFEKLCVKQGNLKYLGPWARAMRDVTPRHATLAFAVVRARARWGTGRTTAPKPCVVGTVLLREVMHASPIGWCHVASVHSPELTRVPRHWLATRCLTTRRPPAVAPCRDPL
jgi:hypothetical protein